MESSSNKTLKDTIRKAQKEVRELLAEVKAKEPDRKKLETRLTEVQGDLDVLDIHIGKHT
jgi:signal transduction histidine kinase